MYQSPDFSNPQSAQHSPERQLAGSRFCGLSLSELLTRVNPSERSDDELRRTVEFERSVSGSLPPFGAFGDHWDRIIRDEVISEICAPGLSEIRQRVAGRLLIDIGGGGVVDNMAGRLQSLAQRYHAAAFINVDRYAIDLNSEKVSLAPTVDLATEFGVRPPPGLRSMLCKADMLDFLTRLPDGCCNIVMNGIDSFVIHYADYRRRLTEEIARVVAPGGVAFGIHAEPLQCLGAHGFLMLDAMMPVSNQISLMVKPEQ